MVKGFCGKLNRLILLGALCGFAANSASAQCGPSGLQHCPDEGKRQQTVSKPVFRTSVKIPSPKSVPQGSAKINAQAAAKIKQAEKFYNYAVNNCGDSDANCKILNFTKAIELNPKYAEAYAYRGYIYTISGDGDKAISDYNKAIQLDPANAETFYN